MSKQKVLPTSLYRQLKDENHKLRLQLEQLRYAEGCDVLALRNTLRKRDEHIAAAEAQITAHLQELGDYDALYECERKHRDQLARRVQELKVAHLKARWRTGCVLAVFAVYVLVDVLQCFLPMSG